MTDFTHHTPKLLTEADAAADLAGLPRPPNDLPSVGTEDALRFATLNEQCANAWKESSEAHKFRMDTGRTIRALVSERDDLASRVLELEAEVLDQCRLNGMGAERESALMGRVRELVGALAGLLEQVEKFTSKHGEADFETAEALRAVEAAVAHEAAPTEAKPAQDAVDAELLDWLEAQINEHGAIHLHDGNNPNGHGLGLRPGSLNRSLREAIRAAISAKKGQP